MKTELDTLNLHFDDISDQLNYRHDFIMEKLINYSPNATCISNLGSRSACKLPFKQDIFNQLVLKFVIDKQLPLSFFDQCNTMQDLLDFCARSRDLNVLKTIKLPLKGTVKTNVIEYYTEMKLKVATLLQGEQYISLTTDVWTAPTGNNIY